VVPSYPAVAYPAAYPAVGYPTVAAPVVAPAAPAAPALPAPKKDKEASLGNVATVVIKAPTDVRITVDGQETPRQGSEESFTTPALEPGSTYSYTIKAEAVRDGRPVTVTRRLKVQAGRESHLEFTEFSSGPELATVKEPAHVSVRLPADARLYIDDILCPLTSERREFDTPKLRPGQTYYYTLRAEVVRDSRKQTETRRVLVEAGKAVTVEFKDLPVQSARR
jgi:uncharacterized protein (TIGR03000 family)